MRLELSPGRALGSTLITLRSRLFLKRSPASLSAMTWSGQDGLHEWDASPGATAREGAAAFFGREHAMSSCPLQ